ncbi:MAG: alpha/beta fold hydrolase [Acidimicrobiales bacterium]
MADAMAFRIEPVHFFSAGELLSGELYAPESGQPAPGVVMVHGMNGIRWESTTTVVEWLASRGFTVLTFDWRGCSVPLDEPRDVIPFDIVEDLYSAVTFMRSRPEVLDARISLVGQTFGGGVAVAAAALDQRVRCVVTINGFSDGERWIRARYHEPEWTELLEEIAEDERGRTLEGASGRGIPNLRVVMPYGWKEREASGVVGSMRVLISLRSLRSLFAFKPEALAPLVAPRALVIIHAQDGQLVPTAEADAIYDRAGEGKIRKLIATEGGLDLYGPFNPDPFAAAMTECVSQLQAHG